jgi:serine O-acetyltransferase
MNSLHVTPAWGGNTVAAGHLWAQIVTEVRQYHRSEPQMTVLLERWVLQPQTMTDAMAIVLADKLGRAGPEWPVHGLCQHVYNEVPELEEQMTRDLLAVRHRDPACFSLALPFLFFKGFHALQVHRIAHCLWRQDRKLSAFALASANTVVFGVDIHPAARIGAGVMIDHATGVVIGETAVVGDDVSILHGVTLGSNGHDVGDRHPKVGSGVLIGAGATLLGNIHIGDHAKIGAGAVVLQDVPAHQIAIGIPARCKGTVAGEG